MKISELFTSLQGESRYAGEPMLFIRLSGCNRACSWCDTKYHTKVNYNFTPRKLAEYIKKQKAKIVCFTGGEPLIQFKEIQEVRKLVDKNIQFHLESNGDFITDYSSFREVSRCFSYLDLSPKVFSTAKNLFDFRNKYNKKEKSDVKVVYDGKKEGRTFVKYASVVMPLTTYNRKKDIEIMKKTWAYCVKNNKKFSPRLQYFIFGKKRGI